MMTNAPILKRVLYVDDAPDIRMLVQMALENMGGIEVTLCENAESLPEKIVEAAPQMILLDVVMPEMNGPDILKQLKSDVRFADIPIAFLTSRTSPADIELFTGMGAIGVIAKSFNPMTLAREVQAMWRKGQPSPFVKRADSYDDAYRKLHDGFMGTLRETMAEMQAAHARFKAMQLSKPELEKVMHSAHRLAGSSAAFGFPDLAVRARMVDQYIDRHIEQMTNESWSELQRLTADLSLACGKALDV